MDDMRKDGSENAMAVAVKIESQPSSTEMICQCYAPHAEMIDIEQVLATQMRQKVVELDLIVPQDKPDIKQIIDVYVKKLKIKQIDVICNKVVLRGQMEVKVMYVANLPDGPVHAFEDENIKFTRDIDIEGALPGMNATADGTVEYIDFDFEDCAPKKVHISIVLKLWTRVTTITAVEISAMTEPEGEEVTVSEAESAVGMNLSINGKTGEVTANRVNIRTGPGMNYPSITKVNKGEDLTIKEKAFGWYKVVLPDKTTTGWIAGWFVDLDV